MTVRALLALVAALPSLAQAQTGRIVGKVVDADGGLPLSSARVVVVGTAQFAWLVFPDHVYARPQYDLDPAVFWMRLQAESSKGLGRAMQRYGGEPLALLALTCTRDTAQIKIGPAKLWSGCNVRYRAGDSVVTHRLFGSIVERDGRAKLLSFANEM